MTKVINFEIHQNNIQLALCRRDYELLAEHHPDLLEHIEQAIIAGVGPQKVKQWAMVMVSEPVIVQRVYNAARWLAVENSNQ